MTPRGLMVCCQSMRLMQVCIKPLVMHTINFMGLVIASRLISSLHAWFDELARSGLTHVLACKSIQMRKVVR
jgi:hypothetical protein